MPARVLVDNPLARHGIHAAERERGTHRRKVAGADGEAALTRVEVDGIRGITRERAAALKQVRDAPVHEVRLRRRAIDILVEVELPAANGFATLMIVNSTSSSPTP
jgi:hypothetical protein